MKKYASIVLALSWVVLAATLSVFQNCAQPSSIDPGDLSSSSSTAPPPNTVPGAANSNNDLNTTGLSSPAPTPQPVGTGGRSEAQYVATLYSGLLQRQPTSAEQAGWAQAVASGYGCTFIAKQVMGSAEYVGLLPTQQTLKWIDDMYMGLLGRAPTATEQSSALNQAAQYPGNVSGAASAVATSIFGSGGFASYCYQFENMTL